MNALTAKKLPPLMAEYLKDGDTEAIVNDALEIAKNHPYYAPEPMGAPARFSTFLTKEEVTDRVTGKISGILVPEKSWMAVYRFGSALIQARVNAKKQKL